MEGSEGIIVSVRIVIGGGEVEGGHCSGLNLNC